MDNELYELCRQVYEKTSWDERKFYATKYGTLYVTQLPTNIESDEDVICRLYTSDYLLEKLPRKVRDIYGLRVTDLQMKRSSNLYYFWYGELGKESEAYLSYADTPIKALLKLTIALHEAGELVKED